MFYSMSVKFFGTLDFAYSVCIYSSVKLFAFWMFILHIEFNVHLVKIDAQMMFKHDLDHLSLDPGLTWMFEKKCANPHCEEWALHCNYSRALCMAKNQSRVAWPCSQHIIAHCPYTLR